VGDGEERARHLALAAVEPDEHVAAEVEEAAASAFRRGAPSAAAELMAQALRLTPAELAGERRRRSTSEAGHRFEAGDTRRADAILGRLVAETAPGPDRAALLARQARVRHFGENVRGGVELLRRALREAGDDPRLRVEIEEGLVWGLLLVREDLPAAAAHARSAVRFAERLGDDAALAEALAAQAMTEALLGRDAGPRMSRALALEPATRHLRVLRHPSFAHGYLLAAADDLDRARALFGELRTRAEDHGDESAVAPILAHLSIVETLAGNLALGGSLADEAYDLALQSGQVPSQVAALGRKALAQAMRGQVDEARATAHRSLAVAGTAAFDPSDPRDAMARGGEMAVWALGHLALSLDDPSTTERYLGPMCDVLLEAGILEPGELRPLADRIEALAGLGRFVEATRFTERLEDMARVTRRPSVLGAASRSRAIVTAATGDVADALEAARRATAAHAAAGLPLELARSQLVLGTIQRRTRLKRAARESMDASLASFERMGAVAWAQRARAGLDRIGGRAASIGQLTATERRAAELVGEGHSNKEVAALLFVSPKTIEANLSRVYAKLGVQSRTELVRWLAEERAREGRAGPDA
jgi:DNA-binding CsgD family transcriptional regulator